MAILNPDTLTAEQIEAGLLYEDWYWDPAQITYSIPDASSVWFGYIPASEPGALTAFTDAQAARFRAAMQLLDGLVAPAVTEVADSTPGAIRAAFSGYDNEPGVWGYAYLPAYQGGTPHPKSGDIWIRADRAGTAFEPGTFDYQALLHEIGHAMGLKHSFESVALPAAFDNTRYTVMAYDPLQDNLRLGFATTSGGGVTTAHARVHAASFMVLDIAALQQRYGADATTALGDTVYVISPDDASLRAIYDAGGTDTLDASALSRSSTIDLTPGRYSSLNTWTVDEQRAYWQAAMPGWAADFVAGEFSSNADRIYTWEANFGIAKNTVIENAVGGSAADKITGNAAANVLEGRSGDDILEGGAGPDTLLGGAGNDRLDGGTGADAASYADAAAAVTVSLAVTTAQNTGGGGVDTLIKVEKLIGSDFDDLLTGGTAANTLEGGAGADHLRGGAGNDALIGGTGDDLLNGGAGNDRLDGGEGRDTATYVTSTAGVKVSLATSAYQDSLGGGTDMLVSVENLLGTAFADQLTGNVEANAINAGAGDDLLKGGGGADTLTGGAGADTFLFTALTDSTGAQADRITDLGAGDVIDVSYIDANGTATGNGAFLRIANTAAFTAPGQLRLSLHGRDTWLELNTDADPEAESLIILAGDHTAVTADDAWLL